MWTEFEQTYNSSVKFLWLKYYVATTVRLAKDCERQMGRI